MILDFVNKKSELTEQMFHYAELGQQVYRTRMNCSCNEGHNRRYGILVIDSATNKLEAKIMKCKGCVTARKGGLI